MTNPNLIEDGKATRFGSPFGPSPDGYAAPATIKKHLRRLMTSPIKNAEMPSTKQLIMRLTGSQGMADISMLMAVKIVQEAMKDKTMMIKLINRLEGRAKYE